MRLLIDWNKLKLAMGAKRKRVESLASVMRDTTEYLLSNKPTKSAC